MKNLERDAGLFELTDFEGEGHFGIDFGSYYFSNKEGLEKLPRFKGKNIKEILEIFITNNNQIETREQLNYGCKPETIRHSIKSVIYFNDPDLKNLDDEIERIELSFEEYISLGRPENLEVKLNISPSRC